MTNPIAGELLDAVGGVVTVSPQSHHIALAIDYTYEGEDLGPSTYAFPFTPSQAYQLAAALMNAADELVRTMEAGQ
ncbi:hypothetical protein D2E82_03235 [Mycobacteroides abscessus]|uniref:hypothetical protein n=1 Tax=Mycobacteroides abscessus TaxID=36809 RepID=UPI000E6A6E91|nr:hypothetical protein [Mycobacteroides abscessus]RIT84231.1 hypothetical protein D2E82_03235 [Mycobacteroides abscessus]